MQDSKASQTAAMVALLRAAHQRVDAPRVFKDPLALRIVAPLASGAMAAAGDGAALRHSPVLHSLRAQVAARSRFAEDELHAAVQAGVGQYVLLGAGLDTFAYRNPYPGLRVFEVDHPATQAWKRELLRQAGIAAPESLSWAPIDFELTSLAQGLAGSGWRSDQPSFFAWLGVTMYLSRAAIVETLSFAARLPAGSGVVFDYAILPSLMTPAQRAGVEALAQRSAEAGEPWQSFFDPATLAGELRGLGFARVDDLGADELNARYFTGRNDGLRLSGGSHCVSTWV